MLQRFLHVYHVTSLLLVANVAGHDPFFWPALGLGIGTETLVAICAALFYLVSLIKTGSLQRVALYVSLLMMVAVTLLRLLEQPLVATLVGALLCVTFVPYSKAPFSCKRLLLTPDSSVLKAFGIAALLFASLLIEAFSKSGLMVFASMQACMSVTFIAASKLKLSPKVIYPVIISLLAVALYLVLDEPTNNHLRASSLYLGMAALATFSSMTLGRMGQGRGIGDILFAQPELFVISFFAGLAGMGALLLQMPLAQGPSAPHDFVDSLFTAMSAVSVTGLGVLETSSDFSLFGQAVILLLIQLGGLGIVSLSAWILFVSESRRISVRHEHTLYEMSPYGTSASPKIMIRRIIGYFFVAESVGALVLFTAFLQAGDPPGQASWRALFTAISAFCNAGFSLQGTSMVPYQSNVWVTGTVTILVILGGFAPLMVLDMARHRFRRWSLQEKLALTTTVTLLMLGFVFFLSLEWGHSLRNLDPVDKVSNAWFQSVISRSAGFNSVGLGDMRDATSIGMMFLMFIGGSPGGAAGGIKTVTAAVILLSGLSALRGGKQARAFDREIGLEAVFKAIGVTFLGLASGFCAYLVLAVTQSSETIPLLFETVSALGTVGLSLGATADLDGVGKVVITLCMLAGRVGPLTLVLTFLRGTPQRKWGLPKENVYVS